MCERAASKGGERDGGDSAEEFLRLGHGVSSPGSEGTVDAVFLKGARGVPLRNIN